MNDWQPISTAPMDRDLLVYNCYYGWYRSRAMEGKVTILWPLYGVLGREGGVWYPIPSHWMELPPSPTGRSPMTRLLPQFREKPDVL